MPEPKRALLTGISGFVGSHLAEELLRRGWEVGGIAPAGEDLSNLGSAREGVALMEADLADRQSLESAVSDFPAPVVIHLAAASAPGRSFSAPGAFFNVNVMGTLRLLEALRARGAARLILAFGSSQVYGAPGAEARALTEGQSLAPLNPYAASKTACHLLCSQYRAHFAMPITEVRPFNLIGPRQALGFVLPDFAYQVARIKRGLQEPRLSVGRLSDERDFLDVRDAAEAIADLIEQAEGELIGQVFHVCSGRPTAVHKLLDLLLSSAKVEVKIEQDASRLRPTSTPVNYGSHQKITDFTGWQPRRGLEQSVGDTLGFWMDRV